jgi:hypothetical protein
VEIASCITAFETHAPVVTLTDSSGQEFNYTPDVTAQVGRELVFFEVKPPRDSWTDSAVTRMRRVATGMTISGAKFAIATSHDIDESLADQIELLLRYRPPVTRGKPPEIDWSDRLPPDLRAAWQVAQQECDALIVRLMRRDPGEVIEEEV